MMYKTTVLARLVLGCVLTGTALHGATIMAYVSAPGVQASYLTAADGAIIETFNSLSTGNRTTDYVSSIGTYQLSNSTPFNIQAANQFGGAGGNGKYMTFGAQSGTSSPIQLDLSQAANYFGFWWSANDANNSVAFYSGSSLLGTLTAAQLSGGIPNNSQVVALNGGTYNTSQYYGNPNSGQDTSEVFTYVNIIASGVTFNRIVLSNNGQTGTGFETDNHTIYLGSVTVPTNLAPLSTIMAPEPATWVTVPLFLVALFARKRVLALSKA